MNNFYSKVSKEVSEYWIKRDRALKKIFSGRIKGSFLIEIKNIIFEKISPNIANYYDFGISMEKVLSNNLDGTTIDIDLAQMVIGVHTSNTLFMTDEQRSEMEKSDDYKACLVETIIQHVKLRKYGSCYFRSRNIMGKFENYLYYPVMYDVFVQNICMVNILNDKKLSNLHKLFVGIVQKSIAALTLLEMGLYNDVYPLCRGAIELFVKLLLLVKYPKARALNEVLQQAELLQTQNNLEFPQAFLTIYENRKSKTATKSQYLHYGWVDAIDDYHQIVTQQPYSIGGVFAYLKHLNIIGDQQGFEKFVQLYNSCHSYTHGNTLKKKGLVHYFEIAFMLGSVTPTTYQMLCLATKTETKAEGIDIAEKTQKDISLMTAQFFALDEEKLKLHYQNSHIVD